MAIRFTIVALSVAVATAAADPFDMRVTGFDMQLAPGDTLTGRVTSPDGDALADITVHVATERGEQTVRTDRDGRYAIDPHGVTHAYVFVYGDARIRGTASTSAALDDREVIELRAVSQPWVAARPDGRWMVVPPYSAAAIDHNTWTRAWLLLDVSPSGTVTRLKVLNAPGFDLDAIAIREAWKLAFQPARDAADRAIAAQVVWTFEWPEFWWLSRVGYDGLHLPSAIADVPCRNSGPTRDTYRDCTPPAIANAITSPWIDRPTR